MKRRRISLFLILTLLLSLMVSCGDKDEGGIFTHAELTLVLDESFSQEDSSDFDLLVSNGEAAVSVMRLSFDICEDQGISQTYTPRGFAAFFMTKSEKSDELLSYGDTPYYTYAENVSGSELFYTVTFYRTLNAYFVITYATPVEYKDAYEEKFFEYASALYFTDAPDIKSQ